VSFNQAGYIEANIRSVLDQGYPDVEHIVVDAGSTDGTLAILEKYSDSVDWISEPDGGQSEGLNKGFRMATGDVIGWVNSDDMLAQGALSSVGAFFRDNPDEIAMVGDQEVIDETGQIISINKSRPYSHDYLLNHARGTTQNSLFFRKEVFSRIGYIDESLHYAMDREFFIRLAGLREVPYFPQVLAQFRVHSDAKSAGGAYRFALELLRIRSRHRGNLVSPGSFNDLYIIISEPLRRVAWLRAMVRRIRSKAFSNGD
jgi:glycosyltransferase involved in cell wall biosynthesis